MTNPTTQDPTLQTLYFLLLCFWIVATAGAQQKPWPIKVVIVTTFQAGDVDLAKASGPGEFHTWVEREHLDQTLEFPAGPRPLRINAAHDVLGIVTGVALVNATASVMALGLDPRFDFRHAYWLVNGIAGVDPAMGTVGTAAWARFVVGDVSRSIDPREMPSGWQDGQFAMGATEPGTLPAGPAVDDDYPLNAGLAQWAYRLTRGLKLPDNAAMQANRELWKPVAAQYPLASQPPAVILGDTYASDSYWHGELATHAARAWVKLWTRGAGTFAMTEMEDAGIVEALRRLQALHRVDANRLMVLRVGSNFCLQAPGRTAQQSVTTPYLRSTAFEIAWLTGSTVVHELQANWPKYEATPPSAPLSAP